MSNLSHTLPCSPTNDWASLTWLASDQTDHQTVPRLCWKPRARTPVTRHYCHPRQPCGSL